MDVHLRIENPHSSVIDLVDIDFLVEDGEQQAVVKKVQHPYAIQPCSSEFVKVPLQLTYSDIVDGESASRLQAGQVIPCTLRANLNCKDTISGVFRISAQRLKHLFTVGGATSSSDSNLEPLTGYVNGMHIVGLSPRKVDFELVLRVKNSNPLAVELSHTEFKLLSGNKEVPKLVSSGLTIRGQSAERLVIPLSFTFEELAGAGLEIKPGQVLPFTLKMEFHFRQRAHGAYKIVQEKSGSILVLHELSVKLVSIVLERDVASGKPIAKLELLVDNAGNPISFVLLQAEYAVHKVAGGAVVASAKWYPQEEQAAEIGAGGAAIIQLVATDEEQHPEFGASLWEAFAGNANVYKGTFSMEGKSSDYGKIAFP